MAGDAGVLVWSVPLLLAAGTSFAIAALALRNRSTPGATWLGSLGAVSGVWVVTDLVGVATTSRPLQVGLEYLHTAFGTVSVGIWLLFVLTYTGRLERFDRRGLAVAWLAFAAVVAIDLTGPLHGLVYADVGFSVVDGVTVVKNTPGPLYLLQVLFVFGSFPAGLVLLFRTLWVHDRLFTGQALALLVGSSFPYVLGLVDVLDLEPVGWLPMVPLSIAMLGAATAYAVLREELLGVVPATRRIGESEAFDHLEDGVAVLAADGTVLNVNDGACRMFDRDREAVLGEPLGALVGAVYDAPADLPATMERGTLVVEPRHSPIESATGEVIGHAVLFRDVTGARRREQRLEVLNRVLRHNLRNAVTAVQLNLGLLVDAEDRDERAALAEAVRSSLDDLDALGNKARVVERTIGSEPVRVRSVELPALFDRVVGDAADRFPDAEITVDVPAGASVATHPDRLAVALRNVVENAVVHADGGRPRADVEVVPGEGGVDVAVTDDGPGIPDHEIAVLEEGTETPLEHGSGLGLWLVHWAVTSLGGEVTFEENGDGSTVRLWVPDRDPG